MNVGAVFGIAWKKSEPTMISEHQMSKIEEQIETGHGARWSILKSAMQRIARGEKR
jgi:hypothetical protein